MSLPSKTFSQLKDSVAEFIASTWHCDNLKPDAYKEEGKTL